MKNFVFPLSYHHANDISIFVNGIETEVLRTNETCFVNAEYLGTATVKIVTKLPLGEIEIYPKRENISFSAKECEVSFSLHKNQNIYITMSGYPLPMFFYGNPPEEYDGQADYYFAGGQVYEVGEINLLDNQSVYIERGAVVKGRIFANNAKNIKIYGYGILDNEYYAYHGERCKTIRLISCENVCIENITIVRPTQWIITVAGCEHVHINGVKEIGEVMSSDGVDIVGSYDVKVENCIFRNRDDCVVVKFLPIDTEDESFLSLLKPVGKILVENCILCNAGSHAMEIGHELRCDEIRDVVFRNIDVIRKDSHGAVFGIHAGDQATVRDILYENIYVDHYYEKLVDFMIMRSRYNVSPTRGYIRNITLKDINITKSIYNDGYSISCMSGYNADHTIDGVHFINFRLDGKLVKNADDLDLLTRNTTNITFA